MPLDQTEPRLEAGPRKADDVRAAGAGLTESPPPTSDTDVAEVTLGAYGDWPLDITAGVVAPYPCYIVIDGGDGYFRPSGDRYRTAQTFQGWYGDCGAECK